MKVLVLVTSLVFSQALQGDDWSALWAGLERLRDPQTSPAEAEALRASLFEAVQVRPGDPRADLLRAGLEASAGRDASRMALRLAGLEPSPFGPRERWFLADALPPGPCRAQQVLEALRDPAPLPGWQLVLAWNVAVDECRALRLAGSALAIQESLHERYPADSNLALDLALTRRLLGDEPGADSLLEETIIQEASVGRPTAELWAQRGIVALGFGDEQRGRDYLGKALAQGSDDANLVLSRLELVQGQLAAARHGFRASMPGVPPADWAWRGWGLTLLPAAQASPARRPSLSSSPH